MIHKKSRTTGRRPRRTGEKVAQNTGIDFLSLRLGVVLSLPKKSQRAKTSENLAEEIVFAEDVSENVSKDRRYHFYTGF